MVLFNALKKSIVTTACLLGLCTAAHASVPIFETTNSTTTQAGFIQDAFAFKVNAPGVYYGTLTDNAAPTTFESLTLNILKGFTTTGPILGGTSGPGSFSFLANAPGVYTALLFGVPGGSAGAGSFTISVVPEVETWVMLIIGAGLVAYQLRRKNKLDAPKLNLSFA